MDGSTEVDYREGELYARPYKDGQLERVRVELSEERLVVRRHDIVYEDVLANNNIVNERHIQLERGEEGLGISVQGGLDFKCPVKVYKVIAGSPAERCGEIEERDVILSVNGISMWGKSHDEAARIIQTSGRHVSLHTGKLQLKEVDDQTVAEDQWLVMADIPLSMASLTYYHKGTAVLRPNSFQVISRDGRAKVTLHCDSHTPGQFLEWTTCISDRIRECVRREIERANVSRERNEQIILMGWVHEHLPSTTHTKVWQRKFLVLKSLQLQLFGSPPDSVGEWLRPERSYQLLEMTLKILEPHQFEDQRQNSMVLASGTGTTHTISFASQPDLVRWTRAIHDTTIAAVLYIEKQQFSGQWKNQAVYFILDITRGFVICSKNDLSAVLWKKPFSSLRLSSDDGHSKLRLQCSIQGSQHTETQELILDDLQIAVCAIECFLATKVATLDPDFIPQSLPDLVA